MIQLIKKILSSIITCNFTIQTSESIDLLFWRMLAKLVIVNGFICFIFSQNCFFRNGENKKETAIVYLKQTKNVRDSVKKSCTFKKNK